MKREHDLKTFCRKPPDVPGVQNDKKTDECKTGSHLNHCKDSVHPLNPKTDTGIKTGKVIPLDPAAVNSNGSGRTRNRIMLIISLVLSGVLFFILADSIGFDFFSNPKQANAAGPEAKISDIENTEIQWQKPKKLSDNLRDITGKENRLPDDGEILVQGIICSENNRMAMINGRILKKGDLIKGCRIVDIKQNEVIFQKGLKTWSQTVK